VAQTQGFAALRPGLSNLAPSGLSLATPALFFHSLFSRSIAAFQTINPKVSIHDFIRDLAGDVGQPEVAAGITPREPFVVEPQQMQ